MGDNLGRIDRFSGNAGIGNLYRVIQHGQDLGVVSPKDQKDPKQGWNCIVPAEPPVPGKKIFTDAIMKSSPKGPDGTRYGDKTSKGWRRADKAAKTLYGKGLDAFVDDLAGNLKLKPEDRDYKSKMTALRAISEQLFLSKPVAWRERIGKEAPGAGAADDNLVGEIAELDERLGRGVSESDLMAAAVSLAAMVERGELEVRHVKAYLDETVFDYADQKATLRMTARAMGEMRANVLREGWGDAYSALVRQYARMKAKGQADPELTAKYEAMVAAADKIRAKRMPLLDELGLRGIPAGEGEGAGAVLRKLKTQLGNGSRAAEHSRHWYGARVGFARKDSFGEAEVREFAEAAGALCQDMRGKGWKGGGDLRVTHGFSDGFKKNAEDYLRVLSQGAELSSRLEREAEVRTAMREALSGIPRGKDGLCKAGTYTLSFSVGVDASLGVGEDNVSKTAVTAGLKVGVSVTVTINEDGSAAVADDIKIGANAGVLHKSKVVVLAANAGANIGTGKAKIYPDIDAMCNDTSQAILTAATGKGVKAFFANLFHWGSVNAESRAIAKKIDNYAMRSLMTRSGLMDEADRYLTPMKYNPVANERKVRSADLDASATVMAGTDDESFLGKSGFNANASASLAGTKTTALKYKSHFAQARAGKLKVDEKDRARYERSLEGAEKGGREDRLVARLNDLRRELDDFSRVAAAQKHKTDRVWVAGSDAEYALGDHFEPGQGKKYEEYLDDRNAGRLSGWNRFRHVFQSDVRRTLFLADLAHEAAYCEAELRKIHKDGKLPDEARLAIDTIEDGIYDHPEVHLNGSLAKKVLYETETDASYKTTSTYSTSVSLNIPPFAKTTSLGVTVTDSSKAKVNAPKGRPTLPWDSPDTVTFTLDLSTLPGVGAVVDGRLGDDAGMAIKGASGDLVRESVLRVLNERIADSAGTSTSELVQDIVPDGGVFNADSSHALEFTFLKAQENGKTVYRLEETSLNKTAKQSVGVNLATGLGFSVGLSGSRSSSETVWYRVGPNTLKGVMSHFGDLAESPAKWAAFLHRQKAAVAKLAKNAGQPQYGVGEDCPKGGVRPRTGLMGELDRVQQQMWEHGDREQYDAFVKAWKEFGESAEGDAKTRGDALTALLTTVADFYRETNNWWVRKKMPGIGKPVMPAKPAKPATAEKAVQTEDPDVSGNVVYGPLPSFRETLAKFQHKAGKGRRISK